MCPRPMGELMEEILILLLERGPMRAAEIAGELGRSSRYVSSYLSYWRRRGLLEYNHGFWSLTSEGEGLARRLLARRRGQRAAASSSGSSSTSSGSSGCTGSGGSLEGILPLLEDDERVVLEQLLAHYQRWGSTYTYLDELARAMNADPQWLLSVARRLQAKSLLYIYRDRQLGVRIGLSRKLRELLKEKGGE